MVCTVDHQASAAGLRALQRGGNAVDAAIAASAALAVTTQHMCGMGGDLWALVHRPDGDRPLTLNASGRAGSGSDPQRLRAEGHRVMPFRGDIRSVPVPGCVDGWIALHDRLGRLDLADVLTPAIELAEDGFPVSWLLARAIPGIADVEGNDDFFVDGRPLEEGRRATRPGLGMALRSIAEQGRSGWYGGEFGRRLIAMGHGLYTEADLLASHAEWVEPFGARVWDHELWTVPPNSQGYLSVLGAAIAQGIPELGADPDRARWAHVLIEAAKQAGADRSAVLHEGADVAPLLAPEAVTARRAAIDLSRASSTQTPAGGGGTIYLCTSDGEMAVSLMQSNAAGFGAHLAVPGVRVFLQNRGIGFSLEPGHRAELGPGRRPPSTLSPALITRADGSLRATVGAMGGDGQPQVVLQLAARLLASDQPSGPALSAPRFTLTVPDAGGFDTWDRSDELLVAVESGSPWADELAAMGHRVDVRPWGTPLFGHAHIIEHHHQTAAPSAATTGGQTLITGVAEPRARIGAAVGW
jgi:gamma-glutamyltranspeptidase/glutathione hydrolase